eukprot:COSAG06_NODE_3160_length_5756_cov_2.071946_6_plen_49_part_00
MPNDPEQHGGAPFMFAPGAQISATPVDTGAVMNTSGMLQEFWVRSLVP